MATAMKDVMSWLHPNPMPAKTRNVAAGSATCAPPAPSLTEERVRGRTTARDACQQAAQLSPAREVNSVSPRVEDDGGVDLGFSRNMLKYYRVDREIGRGANGVVSAVTHLQSGRVFACKSIAKRPETAVNNQKVEEHLKAIRREIKVLKMLRSCLNVAKLEEVYEDETCVHIIQELCTGGELAHSVGQRHYSERTAASYMRAVLKTLAQCHAHSILHRDIKPGNFMLETDTEDARIKAIDFGLAYPYTEDEDLTELDMQGTPWFLAPEALSSNWSTKSDVWAAGVMAYQLLTGRLPFNDKRNPHNPVLSAVLRSILTEPLNFSKAYWQDISDDAKDFVQFMLNRDPEERPTAVEALNHPWLLGDVCDRKKGKQMPLNVVQRIQRFGRIDVLQRSLLELIAAELAEDDMAPDLNHCKIDEKARPIMDSPRACAMELVLRYLRLDNKSIASKETIADGLSRMGYRLQPGELDRLCSSIAGTDSDTLRRAAVIASQIDWRYMQRHQKERWLALARRAFDNIDIDGNGAISMSEMLDAMKLKLPEEEVQSLYEEFSHTPGHPARTISFQSFMAMLRQPSQDSLELYDDRQEGSMSTLRSTMHHGTSTHRSSHFIHAHLSGSPSTSSPGHSLLANTCAIDVLREGSHRPSDCSTHRSTLATVFEQGNE